MKKMIALLVLSAQIQAFATVLSVDQAAQIVNWIPDNTLEVNFTRTGPAATDPIGLNYRWRLNDDYYKVEYQQLATQYPGYQLVRNEIDSVTDLKVSFQGTDYSITPTIYPGVEGPYFTGTDIIDQKTYAAILAAQKQNPSGFATVTAIAHIHQQGQSAETSITLPTVIVTWDTSQ